MAIGSGIMFLLYNIGELSYWAASAASYIAGSVCSFFLNKYLTFSVKEWDIRMVILFVATIGASYLLAYSIAKPLMSRLLSAYSPKIRDNAALLMGMCLFTLLNYAGQRFVVFKVKRRDNTINTLRENHGNKQH
jgi:putative flippase GtrA